MIQKEINRYYYNALLILLIVCTIVLPTHSLFMPGNIHADSIYKNIPPTTTSANITASCFSFPLDTEWSVSFDFGDQTNSGLYLAETVSQTENTPVYAAADGIVKYTGYIEYYGISVVIEHFTGNEFVCTLYGCLSMDTSITTGQSVAKGQLLGFLSNIEEGEHEEQHSSRLYFAIRKGLYENIDAFPLYDPPGDITEWYDPSEFITLHTCPRDKMLVSPSDGPYQDTIFWFQNSKLYRVFDTSNDNYYPDILDEMHSLPGWAKDSISKSSSSCLSEYEGWPDGIADIISTESGSNGLLISEYESDDVYLIVNSRKLCFPDDSISEFPYYDYDDVIKVTADIIRYFDDISDNAQSLNEYSTIELFPGQPFTFNVAMLNSGTSIWSDDLQYGLAFLSGTDIFPDLIQYNYSVPDNIHPGDTYYFNSNEITAPSLPGIYDITCRMKRAPDYQFGDTVNINIIVKKANNSPDTPLKPSGPPTGIINTVYTYQTSCFDIENDQVKYIIDWGDNVITESDFMDSNISIEQSHIWHDPGTYQIRVKSIDTCWNSSDWSIPALIVIDAPGNNPPDTPLPVSGPLTCYTDMPCTYVTSSTDPDGNRIKYIFDWNDDTTAATGYIDSGTPCSAMHSWSNPGSYSIKVMAMDSQSAISCWSSTVIVTVYSKPSEPSRPEGQETGFLDTFYEYSTASFDRDGENIKYVFDWGDQTTTETEYIRPGIPVTESHSWNSPGIYEVKVRAITINASSGWSEPKPVTITSSSGQEPMMPVLQSPENDDIVTGTSITFEWYASINATKYILEVNSSETWDSDYRLYYVNVNSSTITLNDFPNNGTTYYWRVRAGNAHTWSTWSSTNSFINIGKPSSPVIATPEADEVITTSTVTFTWNEVEGANRYLIEVNTQSSWDIQTRKLYKMVDTITEYVDSGYTAQNTLYYWRIRAGNDTEWSTWSSTSRFTIAAPLLTTPENNTSVSGNSILFEWTPVVDMTKYLLEINSDPEWDPYTCKFCDNVGNVDEYELPGFEQDGTTYYWRIRGGNNSGWITTSETRSFINTRAQIPSPPTITSPEDEITVKGTSVTYKWDAKENTNKYLLEVNTDPDWDSRKWKLLKDVGNVTEYTDDGYLNDGTYYYWRVRAGNETGWSIPSESFRLINFGLSAPVLVEPADESTISAKSELFKWRAVANAKYYSLEVNSDESWNPKNRLFYEVVGNVTSQKVIDLPNDGTVYYWRVKVSDGSHWSAWSEPYSFTSGLVGSLTVPTLTAPLDNADIRGSSIIYSWSAVTHANQYWLEVNTDPVTWSRSTRKFFGNVGDVNQYKDTGYSNDGTVYYWRVRAGNDADWSTFSTVRSFTNW